MRPARVIRGLRRLVIIGWALLAGRLGLGAVGLTGASQALREPVDLVFATVLFLTVLFLFTGPGDRQ